LANKLPLE
jgi:hypothetical protein